MSIRWRLTLFNALAIGAILALMSLALVLLLSEVLLDGIEKTTRSRALSAARVVEAGEPLSPEYEELLGFDETFVIVRDGEGKILHATGDGAAPETPRSRPWGSPPWERALDSGVPASGEVGRPSGPPDFVYAVPVDVPDGGPAYGHARVVEAGKSYGTATNIESVDGVLSAVILSAFALSLAGAYFLARAALAPVGAVVDSAREITEGDLSKRLPVARPKAEVSRLAATVNDLLSRLEAAFARREEALARQRRFAADAGHELRTPLTSVVGYARMLEEWGLEDPETAREGVAAIRREAERVQRLVEDLLALARGDEGAPLDPKPHDLGAVAEAASHAARAAAGGKVDVEYDPPARRVEAVFDRGRVGQAAAILLDNAVKYTPEGGRVTATVRQKDGLAELAVSDTGVGIPEERLPLIFERFYRVDEARAGRGPSPGGAGLGLAIARQIAEAHGGAIEAKSTPGRGSTFVLRLPQDAHAPQLGARAPRTP